MTHGFYLDLQFGPPTLQGKWAERLAVWRRGCQLVAKILQKEGRSNGSAGPSARMPLVSN
jgi:hypothetical protein